MTDLVLVPAPTAFSVEVDDEAIVLDEVSGTLHLLNNTGALLWACLDGTSGLEEICVDLAEILDVPFERVLADSQSMADELLAAGLVTVAGGEPIAAPVPLTTAAEHGDGCCCGDDGAHGHDQLRRAALDGAALFEPNNH